MLFLQSQKEPELPLANQSDSDQAHDDDLDDAGEEDEEEEEEEEEEDDSQAREATSSPTMPMNEEHAVCTCVADVVAVV